MVGNLSNYRETDVLRVLFSIGKEPMSRLELCGKLELGEGTMRTILDILKNKKLISSERKGHFLSEEGIKKISEIRENIEGPIRIKYNELHPKLKKVAVLVKKWGKKISFIDRDTAIKNGAEAALLFRFDKNLFLPQAEQDIINTKQLKDLFEYQKNDVLIITFAHSYKVAENSAFAVYFQGNRTHSSLLRI